MKKTLLALSVTSVLLGGCTAAGLIAKTNTIKNISSQSDAQRVIKRGMTKSQVEKKLGSPMMKQAMGNKSTWMYQGRAGKIDSFTKLYTGILGGNTGNSKSLRITFNSSERVSKVQFSSQVLGY